MIAAAAESSLAEMARLAGLRHRLDMEGYSEALAASVRETVESLPPDLPEVCRAYGAEVLRSVEASRGQGSRWPSMQVEPEELSGPGEEAMGFAAAGSDHKVVFTPGLDLRFPLPAPRVEVPGHVTALPETHGLVHGGVIQARGFRLVVKAFPFYEIKQESSSLYRFVAVAAGVCDRFDGSGKLVSTWSTAERLGSRYASTAVALPPPPLATIPGGIQGFFRFRGRGIRSWDRWKRLKRERDKLGIRSSSSFVIDTPYVSVFSLGPDSSAVIVSLPRVFRDATVGKDNKTVYRFERKESWEVRLFSA